MKKILILILLFCFGSKAHAQLPELGWTKEQVEKFMEGKYKYNVIDTQQDVESCALVFRFAPVSFFGFDGYLLVTYNKKEKVNGVSWICGHQQYPPEKPWIDPKIQAQLDMNLAQNQILNLVDSISRTKGKPKSRTEKDDEREMGIHSKRTYSYYYWVIGKQKYELHVNSDGEVAFEYNIFGLEH